MDRKNDARIYFTYALSLGTYWAGVSTIVGFAAPYLQSKGFASTELGVLVAAANLISLLLSLELSARTDSAGERAVFTYLFALLAVQIASMALLFLCHGGIIVALAYAALSSSILAGSALYVKLFVTLSKYSSLSGYGKARASGSLCYALASFAGGAVMKAFPSNMLIVLNVILVLVQLLGLLSLKSRCAIPSLGSAVDGEKKAVRSRGGTAELLPFLRRNPGFPMLLLGVALVFMVHNSITTFMINIVEYMGGDVSDMGIINGLSILVEIPFMTLCSRIDKKHCRTLLMLSFAVFAFKICITATARSIPVLFIAFALRAVAFAIYTPAVVDYIASRIPYEDSGKAQGLAANVPMLGTMVGSVLFGFMFDHYSVPVILLSFCTAIILGSAAALIGIRKK